MSKAVKGITRAIGKVVKGAVNVVKKVAKSKLGKIALTAAAVYFGGAALMGAMGTGTTAMGGLQAAWQGLGTAVSGGGIGGMTSAFTTGAVPGAAAAGANAAAAGAAGVGASGVIPVVPGELGVMSNSLAPMALDGAGAGVGAWGAPAKTGMWKTMLGSPHTMPAAITAGGTMLSSLGNAKAQEEMWNRQQQLTDEERARYSKNIGSTVNFQPRRG